jgi:hypothetical protein
MDSIYFVKKDKDGNITGTGQWHPGDAVNYIGHEQVSKEEWDRINAEIVRPRQEQAKENAEARQYLSETDWYIIRELETGKKCPEEIRGKRETMRLKVSKEKLQV